MTKTTIHIDESHRGRGVTTIADPITIEIDEDELARGPAEAIAGAVSDAIVAIATPAAPATVARRRRDGSTSKHLFYASGTLAQGVKATPASDGGYNIVAPPGRLEKDELVDALAKAAPLLDDPTTDPDVKRALAKADTSISTAVRGRR